VVVSAYLKIMPCCGRTRQSRTTSATKPEPESGDAGDREHRRGDIDSEEGLSADDAGDEDTTATNPFDDGFVSELLGSVKMHDFRKGADWPAGKLFNLVQRRLRSFDGKGKPSRAKTGARRDT
jgi:hypothetical protein